MPVGKLKNTLYGMALPLMGKRCEWTESHGGTAPKRLNAILHKHHVVGGCIQRFAAGKMTNAYAAGWAALEPEKRPVTTETVFRTASIAKMVTALLVFRLQTLGRLHVQEDISDLFGYRVRNLHCPDAPITLGMLLSHTSGIVDSPAYFASFSHPAALADLLNTPETFSPAVPGTRFRYSNLAAGMVGCMLEKRFGESLETLAQKELFAPLNVRATFDAAQLAADEVADSWRVLPAGRAFCAAKRIEAAKPMNEPDPEHHYLLASGNLFLTAKSLAVLTLAAWNGADGLLNAESLEQMHNPIADWPDQTVGMRHGMGLLKLEDAAVCSKPLWGHQGFAYGAVNGVFFDADGNGFAFLNSGASEQRTGHLALVNRDLIRLWLGDGERGRR